jgi:predicted ATPase/DNA-binding CsgD family transcriptional regulator
MVAGGPLIGRESELAALGGMLTSTRVLTVTGTGGCGKTRLALELAKRVAPPSGECAGGGPIREGPAEAPADRERTAGLEESAHGEKPACVVVALASVASEGQLIDALLAALSARERFGSRPRRVLLERVASHRRLLLVLDNCEHLLTSVRALTAELLEAAPGATVLATSREPLGLAQETVFQLGPLSLPELDGGVGAVVRSDAGRLFVDRAAAGNPQFALTPDLAPAVAWICHELDGLPLALGLAAARLDTMSVQEIAQGLSSRGRLAAGVGEDGLSQHRSVRASLHWSYRLLDRPQQTLLRRLSRFSGGFTVAAAHAVCGPEMGDTGDTSETCLRELLAALEAKGLIVPAQSTGRARAPDPQERWTFLQTVGEYASEQLTSSGEHEQIATRHLAWFGAYARRADAMLLGPDGHELIDEERANLRLAFELAIARHPSSALHMAAGLMRHWVLAEHFDEARSLCAEVLSAVSGRQGGDGDGNGDARNHTVGTTNNPDADTLALAVVYCGAGVIGMLSEDYAQAIEHTQTGLALLADVEGDGHARADCLIYSSMVLIQTGLDLEAGLRNAERAVELQCDNADDPLGRAWALVCLATAAGLCDRFDRVGVAYEELLRIPHGREHARLRTWAEGAAAWAQVSVGSPERALEHAECAIALEGDWPSMTHFQAVGFRIQALARLGHTDRALHEGTDAMRRARDSGALQAVPAIELALMLAELMRGDYEQAAPRARRLLAMPHLHTVALTRETLARIALARGDTHEAETQACELESIAQRSGSPRHRALADYIRGSASARAGESDRARELLHAALATCAELDLRREATDVLDELALLAVEGGEDERGARLAAAAAQARVRLGCVSPPDTIDRVQAARARIAGGDGASSRDGARGRDGEGRDDRWEQAWAQGEALTLTDAIAYARRGRGRRDRPVSGWASLTPIESDVAQLAARGISNPEIAAQLFIARGTVKMHLSSVYRKLGVCNRTELAGAIATRASDSGEPGETVGMTAASGS